VTSNAARAAVLMRALFVSIHHDRGAAVDIYTDDVRAWTPAICTSSLAELMAEFDRRDDAFSDIELGVAPLEVGGDYACAEWRVTMTHTGQLAVHRGRMVKPTGARVTLHGIAGRVSWRPDLFTPPVLGRTHCLRSARPPARRRRARRALRRMTGIAARLVRSSERSCPALSHVAGARRVGPWFTRSSSSPPSRRGSRRW
jgi:SnoaL-like domain